MGQNADMAIRNREGKLIHESDFFGYFSDLDLPNAVFAGMPLQGADFFNSNLSGADFRGADLYWSFFVLANLTGADFEGPQLQGR